MFNVFISLYELHYLAAIYLMAYVFILIVVYIWKKKKLDNIKYLLITVFRHDVHSIRWYY